ncbi:glycosyltransferase family 2 protein [Pseudaestuariivita rosea]|uniref:glycosyltransferase family 2 protein n=1 Tax=Pseudaestuariivita rosea TaxID=2763263 RepID=UPI001ABABD3D|nr:glycosyltransferase family 2 protein [Pseudaestuariivita rosea]
MIGATRQTVTGQVPQVSVIMANYNGASFIEASIQSALQQTIQNIEVIVADDASTDRSISIVKGMSDSRIRLLPAIQNGGPGAARNRAIKAARGKWLAIVDSDDLMHPHRLERLIGYAEKLGVDAVADDQICFSDETGAEEQSLFGMLLPDPIRSITPALMAQSSSQGPAVTSLGFMKPVLRCDSLQHQYRTDIRIGEDFDLYMRYLADDARAVLIDEPLYFYRRHTGSISHRWSTDHIKTMIRCNDDLLAADLDLDADAIQALHARTARLMRALRFEDLVHAIKTRNVSAAGQLLLKHPVLFANLTRAMKSRLNRSRTLSTEKPAPKKKHLLALPQGDIPEYTPVDPQKNREPWPLIQSLANTTIDPGGQITAIGPSGVYALGYILQRPDTIDIIPDGPWPDAIRRQMAVAGHHPPDDTPTKTEDTAEPLHV